MLRHWGLEAEFGVMQRRGECVRSEPKHETSQDSEMRFLASFALLNAFSAVP